MWFGKSSWRDVSCTSGSRTTSGTVSRIASRIICACHRIVGTDTTSIRIVPERVQAQHPAGSISPQSCRSCGHPDSFLSDCLCDSFQCAHRLEALHRHEESHAIPADELSDLTGTDQDSQHATQEEDPLADDAEVLYRFRRCDSHDEQQDDILQDIRDQISTDQFDP